MEARQVLGRHGIADRAIAGHAEVPTMRDSSPRASMSSVVLMSLDTARAGALVYVAEVPQFVTVTG